MINQLVELLYDFTSGASFLLLAHLMIVSWYFVINVIFGLSYESVHNLLGEETKRVIATFLQFQISLRDHEQKNHRAADRASLSKFEYNKEIYFKNELN